MSDNCDMRDGVTANSNKIVESNAAASIIFSLKNNSRVSKHINKHIFRILMCT